MGLAQYRRQVDNIDKRILVLVAKRQAIVRNIGRVKKSQGMALRDKKREKEMLLARDRLAESLGVNKRLARLLFQRLIRESYRLEKQAK